MTKLIFSIVIMLLTGCNGGGSSEPMSTVFTPSGPVFVMPTGNNTYMRL